ncbi:hypothetical protein [Streptomyces sp. NPDC058964]|uniref:hypothetical protein n=1 Tax=Streptomyces sp. NPDC058964 TaxID=3346681 RepID=UPI00367A5370
MTGVRVTEELLRDAEHQLGHVPEEPAEEWTGVVIDMTDVHGKRFYRAFTRDDVEDGMARARARAESAEPSVNRAPTPPAPRPAGAEFTLAAGNPGCDGWPTRGECRARGRWTGRA